MPGLGWRALRGARIVPLLLALGLVAPASALAAHQISATGHPGGWYLVDRAAEPGAKCSYVGGGAAGTVYLTGIKLLHGPTITGIHGGLRSVGYRPIVQHREGGSWVTVRRGTLITGQASTSTPVSLPGERTQVPVVDAPNRFRLLVRLYWFASDASVEATRTLVVDSYARTIRPGVGSSCAGAVSNVS
ncbi:MAG: hypothetical protein U0667_13295 [Chloroflexota bacterium]